MKQAFLLIALLGITFMASAQHRGNKAIGLRFGGGNGYGAELSFQTPFEGNRLEADLGIGGGKYWHGWTVTALYQWVMNIDGGFNWYLGVGPAIGYWDEKDNYYSNNGGMYLAASLNAGIEYDFREIPLQLSLDFRPEFGILNRWDSVGGGLGFSVRYCF